MPRLKAQDWDRAKVMWASGKFTLEELAQEFTVTPAALHRRFKKDGIVKGEDAERLSKAVSQAVENKAIDQAEELAQIGFQSKELCLRGAQMLVRRGLYEIKKATQESKPLAAIAGDIKVLNEMSKVIQTSYKTIGEILGFDHETDDDDKLPELRVRGMSPDEIDALRTRQSDEDDDGLPEGASGDADSLVYDDDIEIEGGDSVT